MTEGHYQRWTYLLLDFPLFPLKCIWYFPSTFMDALLIESKILDPNFIFDSTCVFFLFLAVLWRPAFSCYLLSFWQQENSYSFVKSF